MARYKLECNERKVLRDNRAYFSLPQKDNIYSTPEIKGNANVFVVSS